MITITVSSAVILHPYRIAGGDTAQRLVAGGVVGQGQTIRGRDSGTPDLGHGTQDMALTTVAMKS